MNVISDDEPVRRLNRLRAVTPTAEATGRALEGVRRALAENPVPVRPALPSVANRWAPIAALLLVTAGLTGWLIFSPPSGRAWADVQAAMKAVHSVTFRETTRKAGQPDNVSRAWILSNGLCHMEPPNGHYIVADFAKGRIFDVDPQHRSATLWQGVSNKPPANLYELIKNLPGDATARPLAGKNIDGRDVLGFAVKVEGHEATVWADSRTRLPVRIESDKKDEKGKKVGEEILDDFVFDKELDPKLFSFEPPAGYQFVTLGTAELPAAPNDPNLIKPTVTPLVGIGPVKFGTSIADVEKLLGKADEIKEFGQNGYTEIRYWSRGYIFGAGMTSGVVTITCGAQAAWATKIRDFAGKTDKGIGIGTSAADIIRAYGEPSSKESNNGSTYLTYNPLQCHFTLFGDKLVSMTFNRPRPAK